MEQNVETRGSVSEAENVVRGRLSCGGDGTEPNLGFAGSVAEGPSAMNAGREYVLEAVEALQQPGGGLAE